MLLSRRCTTAFWARSTTNGSTRGRTTNIPSSANVRSSMGRPQAGQWDEDCGDLRDCCPRVTAAVYLLDKNFIFPN